MSLYLQPHFRNENGTIAQLVEQWTENPCVPGSNPGSTTQEKPDTTRIRLFCWYLFFLP